LTQYLLASAWPYHHTAFTKSLDLGLNLLRQKGSI